VAGLADTFDVVSRGAGSGPRRRELSAALLIPAAALLSGLAVVLLRRSAWRLPMALPNPRSLHAAPVLRVGGLAIWAGALPVAVLAPPALSGPPLVWLAAVLLVAAVSLRDDFAAVPVTMRLAVHTLGAAMLAACVVAPEAISGLAWTGPVVAATLLILWGANLYNFMDGSDGLAALMTIAGFASFATAAALRGEPWSAYAALVAASLPFLAVNRPPASMFLGDVGAVPLGLIAAGVGLDGWMRGAWPAWFPLLVFLPFVVDASVTLARRLLRKERVVEAHRSHYYQRLVQLGLGHGGTLAIYGALMVAGAASAVACLVAWPHAGPATLAFFCAVHAVLFAAIDYHWRKQVETR
jgi:UDP-N-acetylmuramyl pentapeptide phosphotransferase/UDP-N-acetylglucosamine-1-phosphate transferase